MSNIDNAIKKMNTANILLDAFGDGREFTMHDYKELAASANKLFGGRCNDSNVCYSVSWVREHLNDFGIQKVGSREIEVVSSHSVYKRAYSDYFQHEIEKYDGFKNETKTVEQYVYRMTNVSDCMNYIAYRRVEVLFEINNVEKRIEYDQKYLEKLKNML